MPPTDVHGDVLLVADSEGESHRATGLERGFREPYAIVQGPDGVEFARGAFPREIGRLEAALARFRKP